MARMPNQNPTRRRLTIDGDRGDTLLPRRHDGARTNHIIPFCELKAFWNGSVESDLEQLRETFVPALRRAMTQYPLLQDAAIEVARADRLLRMIETGNYVHNPDDEAPEGIVEFQRVYSWMPGNLFPGPEGQHGDPGGHFDRRAIHVMEDDARYVTVLRAHQAIESYLPHRPNAGLARAAGMALACVARYIDMTAYAPERW